MNLLRKNEKNVLDEYNRTLRFRMERKSYKTQIYQQLSSASSLKEKIGLRTAIAKFSLNSARMSLADGIFAKAVHTSHIQGNGVVKYGTPFMIATRMLGSISTVGPVRYGLNVAWMLIPNPIRNVLVYGATKTTSFAAAYVGVDQETTEFYTKLFLENAISLALMPQYYVISTVLSNVVYYGFKDSGYDNCEAFASLLCDGAAYSLATGSGNNYTIDERYQYHLHKNLSPFIGDWAATQSIPSISAVDSLSNSLNAIINSPFDYLGNQYGTSISLTLNELRTNLPDLNDSYFFTPVIELSRAGYNGIRQISSLRSWGEEISSNAIERMILFWCIEDCSFKFERFQAHRAYQNHFLGLEKDQLDKELQPQIESQETTVAALKRELDAQELKLKDLKINKISDDFLISWGVPLSVIEVINKTIDEQEKIVNQKREIYEVNLAELKRLQQPLAAITLVFNQSLSVEQLFYQRTVGFAYAEDWKTKYTNFKYNQYDYTKSVADKEKSQKDAEAALEKSKFYNTDEMNRVDKQWSEYIDGIFEKYRANFVDWSQPSNVYYKIIDEALNFSNVRAEISKFCADEIIRLKYPLYPDVGDAKAIEAERARYREEIHEHELEGYNRKPERTKDRLYAYIQSKITGIERPRRVHRHQKIWNFVKDEFLKPIANDFFSQLIGYKPFKDAPGGVGNGRVGLQFSYTGNGNAQAHVVVASMPVHTMQIAGGNQKQIPFSRPSMIEGSHPNSDLIQSAEQSVISPIALTAPESQGALDLKNPYMVGILEEQYDDIFGDVTNTKKKNQRRNSFKEIEAAPESMGLQESQAGNSLRNPVERNLQTQRNSRTPGLDILAPQRKRPGYDQAALALEAYASYLETVGKDFYLPTQSETNHTTITPKEIAEGLLNLLFTPAYGSTSELKTNNFKFQFKSTLYKLGFYWDEESSALCAAKIPYHESITINTLFAVIRGLAFTGDAVRYLPDLAKIIGPALMDAQMSLDLHKLDEPALLRLIERNELRERAFEEAWDASVQAWNYSCHRFLTGDTKTRSEMLGEFAGGWWGPQLLVKTAGVTTQAGRSYVGAQARMAKSSTMSRFEEVIIDSANESRALSKVTSSGEASLAEIVPIKDASFTPGFSSASKNAGRNGFTVLEDIGIQSERVDFHPMLPKGELPTFASHKLLEGHFEKHGATKFQGAYATPQEYLQGAHDVVKHGIKVSYQYKNETRIGYVRFMGNTSKEGLAKFEIVGTNNKGNITTYHVESGRKFWKTLNGNPKNKNITPYEHIDLKLVTNNLKN